ncbi:uncharacterized protein B0T15DRAFT_545188 [Chaetomium strumarium]|uniref:Uncharacterized protein n=1 Tax=Chaetomium strumarium TaxID=1170767 RepID=A0AAJ0M541_9PEZI|nr:hypothetical protein B0T15DRAFT_545188 [Chaetomium strumarium]
MLATGDNHLLMLNAEPPKKKILEFLQANYKAVQKTGETTRDRWHKTDWEKVAKDPKSIAFPREDWIHHHDAEKHADALFDETVKKVTQPELWGDGKVLPVGPIPVAVWG